MSVVVLGAGVIGLSTAIRILEKGDPVTIVAEVFPDDAKSIRYTSWWAGAHHVSLAGDDGRQQKMDRETFNVMWEMSESGKDSEQCFMRIPQVEYYCEEKPGINNLEVMPEFRHLPKDELIPGSVCGVSFKTLTIDMPVYLLYLLERFRTLGGRTERASIQHISQLAEGAYTEGNLPIAIVVCAGIGARTLGGVEDKDVYPIRGQTVLLRAPWVHFGRTVSSTETGLWTYIIPRRSGDVIVGGIKDPNDWEPKPRAVTTKDILERGLVLCPELSPSYAEDKSRVPTIEDVKPIIIEEGCGLRPGRNGGIRLEKGILETVAGLKVPIVYNYGHGGYGVQSSWGSASIAANLLEELLQ
ncbi:D-aspartate oxidase [Fomitiporia mediterranea MF3/22]|uniref:D-aspartate oxidase n=1 Tax=Fomitiporia mediterranea (strain MF3/22) TaxID=694068 RepID=UPI0004407780|nr:D-aspartate oxidase [Fomitiporia mediterranea MF3/22]EJC98787.1 D-aspartate oxidase [Fomitiporia mediterranea MF3/22]